LKENDIRPGVLFDQLLALAERDTKHYFGGVPCHRLNCPACDSADSSLAFQKQGFGYEVCRSCQTLFVNPRPNQDSFRRYYTEAPSIKFWATHFYKETEAARREHIVIPQAHLVMEKIRKFLTGATLAELKWIADIGAGYGVFCEEIRKLAPQLNIVAMEPFPELARVCQAKGLAVVPKFLEETARADLPVGPEERGTLTSFELLEHVHDPKGFLDSCRRLLMPGDLFILTTLNGLGLDIQVLWEKSKSVHPPHHINFFNPGSIKTLLERAGFQALEVSTPGKLDVSILENSLGKIPADRFWANFLGQLGEDGKERFQQFLADHGLSSHMMVVAQCR
jgi:2-polyprenyl-3-methyl-5-hydroxy-6-metoxy-1,4-benzoquinol methylase